MGLVLAKAGAISHQLWDLGKVLDPGQFLFPVSQIEVIQEPSQGCYTKWNEAIDVKGVKLI